MSHLRHALRGFGFWVEGSSFAELTIHSGLHRYTRTNALY